MQSSKIEPRACDGCTLCCTINAVQPLGKKPNTECSMCVNNACSIIKELHRPVPCSEFECEWSLGRSHISTKPSECGFFMVADAARNRLHVYVDAAKPDAWKEGRGGEFLEEMMKHIIVIMHCGDNIAVVYTGNDPSIQRKQILIMQRMGILQQ